MTIKRTLVYVICASVVSLALGAVLMQSDYGQAIFGADTPVDLTNLIATTEADAEDTCNVLAISLNGYLSTYKTDEDPEDSTETTSRESSSDEIVAGILTTAKNDPELKAVILAIDSGGGDGVAGEEIANALKSLDKPNVAVIRGMGASAAYWAATGADKIYASRLSDVGSIGVTSSFLDDSKVKADEGYRYVQLSSGKYKDLWDPDKPITEEDKALLMDGVNQTHKIFVEQVATSRKLELVAVQKIANGQTYLGDEALKLGLIDEIGDMQTATKFIEDQIGEPADICWY
ncbi:MAG: S49 family peptidase [Candidatus Vogelbacteria bacterium]